MRVKFWGVRGSVPVSAPEKGRYGGNTTCLQIISDCLPRGCDLVIDGGSGVVPYALDLVGRNAAAQHLEGDGRVNQLTLLFTHYHYDHIQGLPLATFSYMKGIVKSCYGPIEDKVGPREMLVQLFRKPFHPVSFAEIAFAWKFKAMDNPSGQVLLVHPTAGVHLKAIHELEAAEEREGSQLRLGHRTCSLNECLVVRMLYSEHPERTISYRFEERPTGRSFVLLTDHEVLASMPLALRHHLNRANLLVMDAQYPQSKYESGVVAGYGHGTAPYCVEVANQVKAERLGLTHHDPAANDAMVEEIVSEGCAKAAEVGFDGEVFAVRDYLELDV